MVRINGSGNHRFAEPRGGIDDSLPAPAGQGIGGEHHAGRLSVNHPLDHDGEGYFVRRDPQRCPICHCPVRPQRSPALAYGLKDGVAAYDIQVRVLLSRKTGER
jgi:hypothetical protein